MFSLEGINPNPFFQAHLNDHLATLAMFLYYYLSIHDFYPDLLPLSSSKVIFPLTSYPFLSSLSCTYS